MDEKKSGAILGPRSCDLYFAPRFAACLVLKFEVKFGGVAMSKFYRRTFFFCVLLLMPALHVCAADAYTAAELQAARDRIAENATAENKVFLKMASAKTGKSPEVIFLDALNKPRAPKTRSIGSDTGDGIGDDVNNVIARMRSTPAFN